KNKLYYAFFFFSSRRRHTRFSRDWSSDVCSSDLDKDKAYFNLGVNPNIPFILSFGGSGGQNKLNDAMLYVIEKYADNSHIQIFQDRKSVVWGKSVDVGGRSVVRKKERSEQCRGIR